MSDKPDRIDVGDRVIVAFADGSTIGGEVLYTPQDTGDCWHIMGKAGLFYVQTFQHIRKANS